MLVPPDVIQYVVSDGVYAPAKMYVRDRWMVDHASRVIAVWDGRNHSGNPGAGGYGVVLVY